jgi:hypothetical protein
MTRKVAQQLPGGALPLSVNLDSASGFVRSTIPDNLRTIQPPTNDSQIHNPEPTMGNKDRRKEKKKPKQPKEKPKAAGQGKLIGPNFPKQ